MSVEASTRTPLRDPGRIVSLVPSLTEALFELGLGEKVVGVTDYCVHPAREVASRPKLGGTKNPDLAALRALEPDLVIANQEENKRIDVERIASSGITVWLTYPRTVADGVALLTKHAAGDFLDVRFIGVRRGGQRSHGQHADASAPFPGGSYDFDRLVAKRRGEPDQFRILLAHAGDGTVAEAVR